MKKYAAFAVGIAVIVGGGVVAKWLSVEAGSGLIAAGGLWVGKLLSQPEFMRS